MAVYRYSPQGVAAIAGKALRQALMLTAALLLAALLIITLSGGSDPLTLGFTLLPLAGVLVWSGLRSAAKAAKQVSSTEFELDGQAITGRSPMLSTTIPLDQVTELRRMRDGLLVRGKSLRESMQLKPELEGYTGLIAAIEARVPPEVPRVDSGGSVNAWTLLAILVNLALLVLAITASNPLVAIPACLLEALIILSGIAYVLRSGLSTRIRWSMLAGLIPALVLIARAWQMLG